MTGPKYGFETSANNDQPTPINIHKGTASATTSRRKLDIAQNVFIGTIPSAEFSYILFWLEMTISARNK
jgi:hypothetical protein